MIRTDASGELPFFCAQPFSAHADLDLARVKPSNAQALLKSLACSIQAAKWIIASNSAWAASVSGRHIR